MVRKEVLEKINELGRDIFDDEDIMIDENTTAEDIDGWDSLTHLELIDALESEYNVKLTMGEIQGSQNVGELIDAIMKHSL